MRRREKGTSRKPVQPPKAKLPRGAKVRGDHPRCTLSHAKLRHTSRQAAERVMAKMVVSRGGFAPRRVYRCEEDRHYDEKGRLLTAPVL